MSELKPGPRRVQEAADRLGLPVRVVEMVQSTRAAEEAAAACGCDPVPKEARFAGFSWHC